jgi:hypothetical protein
LDEPPQRRPGDPFSFPPNVLRAHNAVSTPFDKQSIAVLPSEKAPLSARISMVLRDSKKCRGQFAANSGDSKMQASHKMWRQQSRPRMNQDKHLGFFRHDNNCIQHYARVDGAVAIKLCIIGLRRF